MKISLSEVMKSAWSVYRARRAGLADWQIARRPDVYSFSAALKLAWEKAKKEIAKNASLESLSESQKEKLSSLMKAREDLQYLPFHMNAARRRDAIDAEIKALVGFII